MKEDTYIIIDSKSRGNRFFRDLWKYRNLLYILIWRDLKVKYKQTLIGIMWVVIRPLVTLLIFTFVFARIAQLPAEGDLPYVVMVFLGLWPWQYASSTILDSSNSIISNQVLITKVYFPRVLIPVSAAFTNLIDFAVTGLLFLPILLFFGVFFSWKVVFIPVLLGILISFTIGSGLILSALNVQYRDFRYILPFFIQFGLYISPVGYTATLVPEAFRVVYNLNPMVGVINGFRWIFSPTSSNFPSFSLLLSIIVGGIVLYIGIIVFKKMEKSFADII